MGTPFLSYIHPEDLQGLMKCFMQFLSGPVEPAEFRISRKDGTYIYVRSCRQVLVENGRVSVAGVLSDITERKRAEETLRQSEERFSKALHASPCAMSIMHIPDGRILDVNQRWQDTLGFSHQEATGKLGVEMGIWTVQQQQQTAEWLSRYGSITNLETVIRNKKGEERDILWSGEIITLDGEPCLLRAWIDITERKKYEKEIARLDRLNLMGEIAAGIAHEIRNPMAVIRGSLQLLQFEKEFASHQKRFNTMIEELDRANDIITEFLSLARNAQPNLKKQSIDNILADLLPLIGK
jgi:PAS domain S-box-containing protein